MDGLTAPALIVFVVGAAGLVLSTLAMQRAIPERWLRPWWRRRRRQESQVPAPAPARRVITGAPAAERLTTDPRPARHLAPRPDVLRRQRERRQSAEARSMIEELLDRDPQLVANMVDQWLAEDRDDTISP